MLSNPITYSRLKSNSERTIHYQSDPFDLSEQGQGQVEISFAQDKYRQRGAEVVSGEQCEESWQTDCKLLNALSPSTLDKNTLERNARQQQIFDQKF